MDYGDGEQSELCLVDGEAQTGQHFSEMSRNWALRCDGDQGDRRVVWKGVSSRGDGLGEIWDSGLGNSGASCSSIDLIAL